MSIQPSLLFLAAGMGSRYGGLKQLDGFGPNGETLMEYSIFDAIRAGYQKIVFVIRRDFEADFNDRFISKIQDQIETRIVFQELSDLPEQFVPPADRGKPWGTAHAVYAARNAITEPFAVLNADDFYGRESFVLLFQFLTSLKFANEPTYCIIGYPLLETLSDFGAVSRGVCMTAKNDELIELVERTKISASEQGILYEEQGNLIQISAETMVSMNMMGFTPSFFGYLGSSFVHFLKNSIGDPKAEHILPGVVNDVVRDKNASVKVIPTTAKWFGVTYKEDKPRVREKLQKMIGEGIYPERLWG